MKALITLLVLFLIFNLYPQADLTINLLIQDNPFPPYGDSEIISFGLDSTATDGIDEYLGESALPPDFCPNLAGVFCAKFIVPNGESTLEDFRLGTLPYTGQKIHKIHCMAMDTSYVIIYNLPLGITANLTDLAGGIIFSATITDSGQIVIPNLAGGFLYKLWIYVNYDNVIPIGFASYTASVLQNEKAVQLDWTTATETNNSGFQIERKSPSPTPSLREGTFDDWEFIGFISGNGTTTETKSYSYKDENLSAGKYQYRLKQIDFDGTFEYSNIIEAEILPTLNFSLEQNYPNPFNPSTSIQYTLASKQFISLKIFNSLGEEIATLVNEEIPAGNHTIEFKPESSIKKLVSGVYLYQLKAGEFVQTKKMILLK